MRSISADTKYWANKCREHLLKSAELGGDGQDMPFEQAFANLAHAYLRDKAPNLLDYEVGFQLLDRSEDNNKAVGIFGFKVGSQWLYAPVFFIDGDLKGHELLYIKNQDMFVPLKENWINYILNKRPNILGEGVNRNLRELGAQSPDLQNIIRSPSKYASALPKWLLHSLPNILNAAYSAPKQDHLDVPSFIKKEGQHVVANLFKVAEEYPQVAKTLNQFYDGKALAAAIKEARRGPHCRYKHKKKKRIKTGSVLQEDHPIKTGELAIIVYDEYFDAELPLTMSDEDLEKLKSDGMVVKDDRPDDKVSKALVIQHPQTLTNPTETGLYDVLTKPGSYEKCLVIVSPHGPDGRKDWVTLIRVDGKKTWLNIHGSRVFVGRKYDTDSWNEWFNSLSSSDNLAKNGVYVAISKRRTGGTVPFTIKRDLGVVEKGNTYEVRFEDYAAKDKPDFISSSGDYSKGLNSDLYDKWTDGERVHVGVVAGSSLWSKRGDLYIPGDCKFIEIKPGKNADDDDFGCCCSPSYSSDEEPIVPGDIADVQMQLMSKLASVTIWNDGVEVEVNDQAMTPKQAMISLIRDHGFREGVARKMLKEALMTHTKSRNASKFFVKYAGPYLTEGQPGAPAFPDPYMGQDPMGSMLPAQFSQEDILPVDSLATDNQLAEYAYNPITPDPMSMQIVNNAAQTGQREIFDTALIGSLLKSTRDDSLIDRHIGDLMKGLDKIGRLLLLFYWHNQKFEERFGSTDMPELEDSLRNSFEDIGDLVLFLRQKSVEADPSFEQQDIDLSEIAGG